MSDIAREQLHAAVGALRHARGDNMASLRATRMQLGIALATARTSHGWSHLELARRVEAAHQQELARRLVDWERGKGWPTRAQAAVLANVLSAQAVHDLVERIHQLQGEISRQDRELAHLGRTEVLDQIRARQLLEERCLRLLAGATPAVAELEGEKFSFGTSFAGGVSLDAAALRELWQQGTLCYTCACGGKVYLIKLGIGLGGCRHALGFCPGHHGLREVAGPSGSVDHLLREVFTRVRADERARQATVGR